MKKLNCVFLFGFLLILIAGCSKLDIQPDPLYSSDESALKGKKVKPTPTVLYEITGDMVGSGPADAITLTLGAAFFPRAGTYIGRVTMARISYGPEKGIRLNFIVADDLYAFVVEHYQKHPRTPFGIFEPGDPWRMQTESGYSSEYPETGVLIEGIKVVRTVIQE
jgi:hypothetical protein